MEKISDFFSFIIDNNIENIKKYINNNIVDINCQDSDGITALSVACYNKRFEIIKFLCENSINALLQSTRTGNTCLHYAIRTNDIEIVNYIINYCNELVNIKSLSGDSPLMFACVECNYSIVEILLEHNADITVISNNKLTTYHCLIQRKKNDEDICKILYMLKKYDNTDTISKQNGIGNTILHLCAERNYINCVKYLLSINFPQDIRNNQGKIALNVAKGSCKVYFIILEYIKRCMGYRI